MRFFDSASSGSARRRLPLWSALVAALVAWAAVTSAQITIPFPNFTVGTTADPNQVNSNFSTVGNQALNRTGGTMTGALLTVAGSTGAPGLALATDPTTGVVLGAGSLGVSLSGTQRFLVNGSGMTVYGGTVVDTTGVVTASGLGTLCRASYQAKTTTYSAAPCDYVVATSGTFSVTLPAAASNSQKVIWVVNAGSGVVTVARSSSDTVGNQGETSQTLNPGDAMTFFSDGTSAWRIT